MSNSKINGFVWCYDCLGKTPTTIRKAIFSAPVRISHYDLAECGGSIDKRVIGLCKDCLGYKNEFQKSRATALNPNDVNLVRKSS